LGLILPAIDPALTITTDAGKVQQILLNLLANAVKYTEEGSVRLDVRLDVQSSAKTIIFTISDTGIGIAPEHLERIFDPFWQVEQKTTRRYGGTGLGLSVTRRLVHLLHGTVTVHSTTGQGSTFTVRLPVS
jgi:signal transduction histidine kinase